MASDLVRFSIAVPAGLLDQFDDYARRRGILTNRSEAIRDLIRDALVEQDLTDPEASVVGSITIVYDHHVPDLTRKIDSVEHEYPGVIVSSMHVHLDHHNCLEIIAVRGKYAEIHEVSDLLLGIKGIVYGKLTCVATQDRLVDGGSESQTLSAQEPVSAHEHYHGCEHEHGHDDNDGEASTHE